MFMFNHTANDYQKSYVFFFRMPGTGNAGNGGTADHDNVMMIGHVNDDPLLEDRAISLPLWGDMAGGENGANEGNGTGAVTGKSLPQTLFSCSWMTRLIFAFEQVQVEWPQVILS